MTGNYSQFLLLRKGSVQEGGNLVASYIFGTRRIEVLAYTPAPYELPIQSRNESLVNVAVQTLQDGVVIYRANLGLVETESALPYFYYTHITPIHIAWLEQAIRSQYLHNLPFLKWATLAGNHFLSDDAMEIEDQWQYDQIDAMIDSEEVNDTTEVLYEAEVGSAFTDFLEDDLDTDILAEDLEEGEDDGNTDNEG